MGVPSPWELLWAYHSAFILPSELCTCDTQMFIEWMSTDVSNSSAVLSLCYLPQKCVHPEHLEWLIIPRYLLRESKLSIYCNTQPWEMLWKITLANSSQISNLNVQLLRVLIYWPCMATTLWWGISWDSLSMDNVIVYIENSSKICEKNTKLGSEFKNIA